MKKIILLLAIIAGGCMANAITLFPHFVDVSGDFNDGTGGKFIELNIPTKFWRASPAFYNSLKDADDFLKETLPFSSYTIDKEEQILPDGTQIVSYISSLEADGLYKDKISKLYLIQTPGEPLYVGLWEDPLN